MICTLIALFKKALYMYLVRSQLTPFPSPHGAARPVSIAKQQFVLALGKVR